jgi:hypothetical protein
VNIYCRISAVRRCQTSITAASHHILRYSRLLFAISTSACCQTLAGYHILLLLDREKKTSGIFTTVSGSHRQDTGCTQYQCDVTTFPTSSAEYQQMACVLSIFYSLRRCRTFLISGRGFPLKNYLISSYCELISITYLLGVGIAYSSV